MPSTSGESEGQAQDYEDAQAVHRESEIVIFEWMQSARGSCTSGLQAGSLVGLHHDLQCARLTMEHLLTYVAAERSRFRTCLLRWYRVHHRSLPWRQTSDPYCIWVSEVMLQQTRVAAVL